MAFLAGVPKFAFGTSFRIESGIGEGGTSDQSFKDLLRRAIRLGCRHIDCAPLYGTQMLVGEVLQQIKQEIPRSELFVTSKLPVNMMRGEMIERSLKKTLTELNVDYLDLFLIHAPFSTKYFSDHEIYPLDDDKNLLLDQEEGLLENCWRKLVDLKRLGWCKFIGLSNINSEQLDRLNRIHQVDVVQNEYHLYNQDRALLDHCKKLGVHFEAYAAFGCPPKAELIRMQTIFDDAAVREIAGNNNYSVAQLVIQWLHQKPISYVIKSDNIQQFEENLGATKKFSLPISSISELDNLNKDARLYFYDFYNGIVKHREYPFKGQLR